MGVDILGVFTVDGAVLGRVGAFLAVTVALLVPACALASVWRAHDRMNINHVLFWIAIILIAPFVGALVWFVMGRALYPDPLDLPPRPAKLTHSHRVK